MSDSRSIFVLTTDFKPMTGGVAEYLHQLWNNVARNCPVTILSAAEPNGSNWEHNYRFEQLPPLPRRHLGERFGDVLMPLRKMNTFRYFIEFRRYARTTVEGIRKQVPSCEAYVGIWDVASHFWCEELYSAGIPYSLHVHGLDLIVPLYGRLPEWRHSDFRKAKAIYANSSATAELVRNKWKDHLDVSIVYPGVGPKPDLSGTMAMVTRLKSELDLYGGPILLTVARLVRRKGIDLVLRCIPGLIPNHPGLRYVVVGEGPEKGRLQQLTRELDISQHVRFLGNVEDVKKWAFYEMCDVFVLPNRRCEGRDWEGFGIVFMEAALSGKPAIGGKNGGVPEAIEDGVTGILVDPERESSISDALHLLLNNAELRSNIGFQARERAVTKFSWSVIATSFWEHLPSSVSDDNKGAPR